MTDPQKTHSIKINPKAKTLAKLLEQRKATTSVVAGEKMPDGTVFVGYTQQGRKLFAMPVDAKLAMDFNAAAAYATRLNNSKMHGHDDWRIPTKEELVTLCRNKDKGALKNTFTRGWWDGETDGDYWSSTPGPIKSLRTMYVQRPADGSVGQSDISSRAAVRCVR